MIEEVRQFINKNIPPSSTIIVGLSGGADSVGLLAALIGSGANCVAAHCNFHLRGKESDRDMDHCISLCKRLEVPLIIKHFDVPARQAATSESLEMACRSLRYDWWNELIDKGKGDFIAVGHHREDNVETFFLNLLRGSGINGLKGMLPVNGKIIRPLLNISRKNIERFVTDKGLSWVDDHTNFENEYKRNRLRNIILPELERQFPGATDAMVKSIGILRDNYSLYRSAICDKAAEYIRDNGDIDVSGIVRAERYCQTMLYELLAPKGFTSSQVDNIMRSVDGSCPGSFSGQIFSTPTSRFILERGILSEYRERADIPEIRFSNLSSSPLSVTTLTKDEFLSLKKRGFLSAKSIYLDSDALSGNPEWILRTWHTGDRLYPFGMKGSRLVSDIFKDLKLSQTEKGSTLLLFRDKELIWIVGIRASRHFCVTEKTRSVIRISML